MQKLTLTGLMLLLALSLLVSGCAKKPAADSSASGETTQVAIEQQQPASISDQAAGSYDAAAAAEAAEREAAKGLVRIHFDFDRYDLTAAAKSILVSNAGLLRAAPALKILIEGHCDERGSDEYNLALGEKRALATKNYLVSLGVAESRMSIISYGEEMPLDSASTKEAWAKNRRANFKVKR